MELIKILSNEDLLIIKDSNDKMTTIQEVTGIHEDYNLGDTAVKIDDVVKNGLYKSIWNGKTFYYIVLNVLDKDLGYAISLW